MASPTASATDSEPRPFRRGASDTLVTKVMLGVFGCVPAFDTYFTTGFRASTGFRGVGTQSSPLCSGYLASSMRRTPRSSNATGWAYVGLRHLWIRLPICCYSRAKVIDMIFFIEGGATA